MIAALQVQFCRNLTTTTQNNFNQEHNFPHYLLPPVLPNPVLIHAVFRTDHLPKVAFVPILGSAVEVTFLMWPAKDFSFQLVFPTCCLCPWKILTAKSVEGPCMCYYLFALLSFLPSLPPSLLPSLPPSLLSAYLTAYFSLHTWCSGVGRAGWWGWGSECQQPMTCCCLKCSWSLQGANVTISAKLGMNLEVFFMKWEMFKS